MSEVQEEIEVLTLEMNDGSKLECEVLDTVEVEGRMFVALLPLDEDEYLVFECKVGDEEGGIEIINIEDEAMIEKVCNYDDEDDDDDDFEEELD
jgi:hypothetical protein